MLELELNGEKDNCRGRGILEEERAWREKGREKGKYLPLERERERETAEEPLTLQWREIKRERKVGRR